MDVMDPMQWMEGINWCMNDMDGVNSDHQIDAAITGLDGMKQGMRVQIDWMMMERMCVMGSLDVWMELIE